MVFEWRKEDAPSRQRPSLHLVKNCGADWGVCPDHGNTLTSSAGTTWCRAEGCGRTWDYDRVNHACEEPAAYVLRDASGGVGYLCAGHALDARDRVAGGTVTPL